MGMKIPLAIIVGKSVEDVVGDTLKGLPLTERIEYAKTGNQDHNIRRGHTYLPLKSTYVKYLDNTEKDKKDKIEVKISECQKVPLRAVSHGRNDYQHDQSQVIN